MSVSAVRVGAAIWLIEADWLPNAKDRGWGDVVCMASGVRVLEPCGATEPVSALTSMCSQLSVCKCEIACACISGSGCICMFLSVCENAWASTVVWVSVCLRRQLLCPSLLCRWRPLARAEGEDEGKCSEVTSASPSLEASWDPSWSPSSLVQSSGPASPSSAPTHAFTSAWFPPQPTGAPVWTECRWSDKPLIQWTVCWY